jgi:predicted O-methyltransferase YrrM
MIKIDMQIPGWLTEPPLRIIAEHVQRIPSCGNILELGAYLGRTSVVLAENAPACQVHTVDLWVDQDSEEIEFLKNYNQQKLTYSDQFYEIDRLMSETNMLGGEDFYKLWCYNTRNCQNITHYRADTTRIPTEQFPDFDFILMDASHDLVGVKKELDRWWPKLKPTGTIIIDDYASWPGVKQGVDEFFANTKHTRITYTPYNIVIVER